MATFPFEFRRKIFEIFFCPKLHQNIVWVLGSPFRKSWTGICTHQAHRGSWKILAKIVKNPQMEKIDGCAWWVHILGVGCGPNKVPYHTFIPYKYWLLTLSQKKVMYLQNPAPKSSFSEGFPLKPCILHHWTHKGLLGSKIEIFYLTVMVLELVWGV